MAEAARAAGLAMPLKGTSLPLLLSGFLSAAENQDIGATFASSSADDRTTRCWPLADGQVLSAESIPIESNGRMIVLRLGPQSALFSDAAAP